jgi:hypothetical protein
MSAATAGMARYPLVYGGIAGAIVVGVITATIALDLPSHATSETVGYLVMLVGLSLIFVGVKRYRDVECGGVIRFGRALAMGSAIAAVAAVIYVLGWETYLAISGHDFITEYSQSVIEGLRATGATEAAITAKTAELESLSANYRNPLFRLPMTALEILPVGVIVALVSAALLRNPKLLPARAG